MAKKKTPIIDFLKTWWPVTLTFVAAFGWLVTNSSQVLAVWKTPEKIEETQAEIDDIQKYITTQQVMNTSQYAINETLVELLKKKGG